MQKMIKAYVKRFVFLITGG